MTRSNTGTNRRLVAAAVVGGAGTTSEPADPDSTGRGRVGPRWIEPSMSDDPIALRRPVTVSNAYGLHLRPAEKFVGLASKYRSEIRVFHRGRAFNGKSILDLMGLAAECGAVLEVEASGPDAEPALEALIELVEARFHEADPYAQGGPAGTETNPPPAHSADPRKSS